MPFFSYKQTVPLLVFSLFFAVSVGIWRNEQSHDRELLIRHTETSAEQIKIRIEALMNARMASLQILADRWVERIPADFSQQRFNQFAEAFYVHYPGFFAINWANPEGVIQWVYPQGEISDKGRSLFTLADSRYVDIFERARQNLQMGTTPCAPLKAGGSGFHVFLPLIYGDRIQGYLDGVFQLERIIEIALARHILENFWVRIYEEGRLVFLNGDEVDVGRGNAPLQVLRPIQFPGKALRLDLQPKEMVKTTLTMTDLPLLLFGLAISLTLSFLLYFLLQRMQLYREARDRALHEVGERKRAEETLRRKESEQQALLSEIETKNEELETFVYTVSHDLKTPLVTIEGFIGALREDFGKQLTGDWDTYLNYMSEAVRKMETLINDLLELSRVGRLTEKKTEFLFRDVVEEVLVMLQPQIQEKGIGIHLDNNLPMVWGERKRVLQVLENLLSNAVKFLGEENPSPRIDIGVQEQNGRKVFYVQDNGIGIEQKYFDKIFQVFQRLPRAKKIAEGTGIGLTTARRIIENHGGKIWLKSTPGKGTTFYFTLQDKKEEA